MSPRRSDARERMLASAAALIRERGAAATSLDEILAHSGAPRGSVYHHFPGGRAQVLEETVERAGGAVEAVLLDAGDVTPVQAFDAFLAAWRRNLRESGFRAGCPVLAVAIEQDPEEPQLTAAAARALARWRAALEGLLREHGVAAARARRLATLVVAAIEGAVVLSRVEASLLPLDDTARELRALLRDAVSPASSD